MMQWPILFLIGYARAAYYSPHALRASLQNPMVDIASLNRGWSVVPEKIVLADIDQDFQLRTTSSTCIIRFWQRSLDLYGYSIKREDGTVSHVQFDGDPNSLDRKLPVFVFDQTAIKMLGRSDTALAAYLPPGWVELSVLGNFVSLTPVTPEKADTE